MATQPEIGVADFVLLDNLTTDKFIENLHLRFQSNRIYTYIGEVLVSVNPYKTLDIYGAGHMAEYRGREMFEVPPHVYAVSDACQRVLRQQGKDTCILISGESGSGKTEASKFIMKYIAANTTQVQREYIDRVKNVLIQSNSILETFGNAKTNRNDNSSRFGKYMDIHFDFKGDPVGGHISNYLLEKSRVIRQQNGERNFHAFYQLLSGASGTQLQKWGLSQGHNYKILGTGKTTPQDPKLYALTNTAFRSLGFSADILNEIWTIVAGAILLGEVTFSSSGEGNELSLGGPVRYCCSALGVSDAALKAAMVGRVLSAGGDLVSKQHSLVDAEYTRDALAKAMYDRLFSWIVQQINTAIEKPVDLYKNTLIGVLDIYGFEIFEINSFEQFCINYCNEKLQQLFIELVLRQEQEEYQREGIQWTPIDYFNNRVICELIDLPHKGVISIMDEACLNPSKVSDSMLLEAMDKRLQQHAHYTSRQLSPTDKNLKHSVDFKITHYAGDVIYSIAGFMDKNKDSLWQDLKRLMFSSTNKSLSQMWPEGGTDIQKTSKRPPSAATLFRSSMGALVQGLQTKEPFYVRCVKPNPVQSPNIWEDQLVRHQVAYLGLVENVRVRRAGFANRQRYDRFLKRYKMLSQYTWPNFRQGTDKDGVMVLLRDKNITDVQYGHTKLFIRSAKTLHALEADRAALIPSIVILLQKLWRGAIARRRYKKMKAAIIISNAWKRYKFRMYIATLQSLVKQSGQRRLAQWPAAPRGVNVALLRAAHARWCAWCVLRPIPRDQWPQLKMKISAASSLRNRRREWGANRQWFGDYLAQTAYNPHAAVYATAIAALKKTHAVNKVLFSCNVHKINKGNKASERSILITDKAIYKLNSSTFKPMKKPIPISDVGVIRVMSGDVQLVVISIPSTKNDLVVGLVPAQPVPVTYTGQTKLGLKPAPPKPDFVGELIGVLANRFLMLRNTELQVEVETGDTTRCMLGGRPRPLQLPPAPSQTPPIAAFTHAHNTITYHPTAARA